MEPKDKNEKKDKREKDDDSKKLMKAESFYDPEKIAKEIASKIAENIHNVEFQFPLRDFYKNLKSHFNDGRGINKIEDKPISFNEACNLKTGKVIFIQF